MATVFDVAACILAKKGAMTTMKLQKLVYYSQAWSTVWDDDVLFHEPIEAWMNGPVVRELFNSTKGQFRVAAIAEGDIGTLTVNQHNTIDRVLAFYGDKNAQWLSDLTHMEEPWMEAYSQGQNTEITPSALSEYYSTIAPSDKV
jgi:uncharacterized phage-associated protein